MFKNIPFTKYALIASLYTTQYLGLIFFSVALVAILREEGASLERISSLYVFGMIGAFSFLWASLIDRFCFSSRLGHYRGWLLLMQSLLIVILCYISTLDIKSDFGFIYILCIILTLCSSTHTMATDGLVCKLLTKEEIGFANGIRMGGGMFGYMIGAGVALMIYDNLGWEWTILFLAMGTALPLIQLIIFKEGPSQAECRRGWSAATRFVTFWRQPGMWTWALQILLFPAGVFMVYGLLTPILVDNKWSMEDIGFFAYVLGPFSGILSSILAGWIISRFDRKISLTYCIVMQIICVMAILFIAKGYISTQAIVIAVFLHFFGYVPFVALLSTLMMDRASKESPATDFTVQYNVSQFFSTGMVGLGLVLAGKIGYENVTYVALCFIFLGSILAYYYVNSQNRKMRENALQS